MYVEVKKQLFYDAQASSTTIFWAILKFLPDLDSCDDAFMIPTTY